MAVTHKQFWQYSKFGIELDSQDLNNSTVAGETIVEPWKLGRCITFYLTTIANGIAVNGSTVVVQGRQRSNGSWVTLKQKDNDPGESSLGFSAAVLNSGGELETNRIVRGTLNLGELDSTTYDAIRLSFTAPVGSVIMGSTYVITDLLKNVTDDASDDLWYKQRYGSDATTQP